MADHEGQVAAAHLGFAVDDDLVAEFLEHTVHEFGADFFVGHFATTEDNHYFDTIAIVEKFDDFAAFNIEVVLPNL